MRLKLRRFGGEDPHPDYQGKCGCQGYDEGKKWECPFKESLEKMKEIFYSTNRLGRSSEIDFKYGFLTMYSLLDHNNVRNNTIHFAGTQNWTSEEYTGRLEEEMNEATMRCHGCHRFKTILCGDSISAIPLNATVLITQEDDMQDPALVISNEDDFQCIMNLLCNLSLGRTQSSGNDVVSITLSSVSKMVSLALITVGSQNSLILGVDNTRCKLVAVVLLILII